MENNINITIYDLLFSLTKINNQDTINYILDKLTLSNVLDTDENKILDEFNKLNEDLGSLPTSGILVNKNPMYQTANTIQEDSLEEMTKLYISNKKKMKIASFLTNSAMEIVRPGNSFKKIKDELLQMDADNTEEKLDFVDTANLDETRAYMLREQEEVKGIPFGITFVDEMYRGITPSSFNVIAGYTGSLKTTLAVNVCYIGMTLGFNTLYLSLEVRKEDMMLNLMTLHSISSMNNPIKRDEMAKLRHSNKEKFNEIVESFYSLPGKIRILDESDIEEYSLSTFEDIINKCKKDFKEKYNANLDHIVLDHAQLLKFDSNIKGINDPYMVVNHYTSYFRKKAARDGYAVTIVSQTSRGGYERATKHNGEYLLTGLAESNELERGATFVLALYSSDMLKASGQVQVQILKNRYGETMLEPQTVIARPEYYMVGEGYSSTPQQVGVVFNENDTHSNPFENNLENDDLDAILGGINLN